jgi:hypothetical protein
MIVLWSFLERLHTMKFAIDLSGMANLDVQTLLLLVTLGVTLMTYRKLEQRSGRTGRARRRGKR